MSEPEDPHVTGWKGMAVGWLARQESTTVLLFCILGLIGWLSYYTIHAAVPAHLRQIQAGYETQAKQFRETAEQFDQTLQMQSGHHKDAIIGQAQTFERSLTEQGKTYKDTMTRIADSFDKGLEAALDRKQAPSP